MKLFSRVKTYYSLLSCILPCRKCRLFELTHDHYHFFQIRTLELLRSRFETLPRAFNATLIPEEKSENTKKKGLKATFSRKFDKV